MQITLDEMFEEKSIQNYKTSILFACEWLIETAQKQEEGLTIENNSHKLAHDYWKGSIRGEYQASTKKWDYFCPIWHTGQAIKSLSHAYRIFQSEELLNGAILGAEFIINSTEKNVDSPNFGLIYAYEDFGNIVNTSAILEACDGLLELSKITDNPIYSKIASNAVEFVNSKLYIKGEGVFSDLYDPIKHQAVIPSRPNWAPTRPLNDDAMFLKISKLTHNQELKDHFYEICDRLLKDEDPKGNWIKYHPCNKEKGSLHPRHAYWWGRPFISAYHDSKKEAYLDIAKRAGSWYMNAMRKDGGLFRGTYVDFNTDSFGQATSGIACAVMLWNDLFKLTHDEIYIPYIKKALEFCQKMQFTLPEDENLYRCILEKVLPFDGSDRNPYHIRDLGTIFYIQAVCEVLNPDLSTMFV
jgi:hypothetical protein